MAVGGAVPSSGCGSFAWYARNLEGRPMAGMMKKCPKCKKPAAKCKC